MLLRHLFHIYYIIMVTFRALQLSWLKSKAIIEDFAYFLNSHVGKGLHHSCELCLQQILTTGCFSGHLHMPYVQFWN